MKFVRYRKDSSILYGLIEDDRVMELSGDIFTDYQVTGKSFSFSDAEVLAPCTPSKIIALGHNYRLHADEFKMELPAEPLLFMKPPSAVIGPEQEIVYPSMSRRVDYEGELGVVIGTVCRKVSVQQAPGYIFGYTCFNDVTARDLQKKDTQWTRAKGFDTFAPMGPVIETALDPSDLLIETFLNGEKKQSASTRDLIFPIYYLISFISQVMTLLPGDVIATGTPSGIGLMRVGDVVEVKIKGIGTLRNAVGKKEI